MDCLTTLGRYKGVRGVLRAASVDGVLFAASVGKVLGGAVRGECGDNIESFC